MLAERKKLIQSLFDEYIEMYASRDQRLAARFSQNFSGYAGSSDQLITDTDEWIKVTLLDFEQIPQRIEIEMLDLSLQDLSDDVVSATAFFHIHLPVPESFLARETARLVLIFRRENGNWMITHSGISIPFGLAEQGEVYPMQRLNERNSELEALIDERTYELKIAIDELAQSHEQLLQSEKLASIGLLAAGVAHEINNPIGYVTSNLGTLNAYTRLLLDIAVELESWIGAGAPQGEALFALKQRLDGAELDYLSNDFHSLIKESRDGLERVRKIVADLKSFARIDSTELQLADINVGLETTLNIASNELKQKAEVVCKLGKLPQVRCNLGKINQIFMHLLLNAAQSIVQFGTITITTKHESDSVTIAVNDTGVGISDENIKRIFDPFFTTKPVGKGTGLGLSISWGIACDHGGRIEVDSTPGVGSTFTLYLPISGPDVTPGEDLREPC